MPTCKCGARATHSLHAKTREPVRAGLVTSMIYCEPCAIEASQKPRPDPQGFRFVIKDNRKFVRTHGGHR